MTTMTSPTPSTPHTRCASVGHKPSSWTDPDSFDGLPAGVCACGSFIWTAHAAESKPDRRNRRIRGPVVDTSTAHAWYGRLCEVVGCTEDFCVGARDPEVLAAESRLDADSLRELRLRVLTRARERTAHATHRPRRP